MECKIDEGLICGPGLPAIPISFPGFAEICQTPILETDGSGRKVMHSSNIWTDNLASALGPIASSRSLPVTWGLTLRNLIWKLVGA